MNDHDRDLFRGMTAPTAPAGLRRRALAAAQAAARRGPARLDERMWRSRPLWMAWAGSALILLALNLMLLASPTRGAGSASGAGVRPTTARAIADELDRPGLTTHAPRHRPTLAESRVLLEALLEGVDGEPRTDDTGDET